MERNQRSGEIARALGLSPSSIQAYARSGRIPYRKTPGGQYRFNLDEVREVLGLADITARRDLVSVFADDAVVGVDALSAFRDDPIDAAALRQARIRGVRSRRAVPAAPSTADAGSAQLAHLVNTGHGACVAVVRREHVDA